MWAHKKIVQKYTYKIAVSKWDAEAVQVLVEVSRKSYLFKGIWMWQNGWPD